MKDSTKQDSSAEDGNVGYFYPQQGGDSCGRTAGAVAGMEMYGNMNAADRLIVDKHKAYLSRQWQRMQHCHAYTVGGVFLYQFALPYLNDRDQRFIMENQRYFYHFHRNTNGGLSYFGGRDNNAGDDGTLGYLGHLNSSIINVCMAQAIASGNLMSFPSPNTDRIYADFKSPFLTWPTIDARQVEIASLSQAFNVDITDYQGTVLNPTDYTATWTHVSGPATASFSSTNTAGTTVTFPQDGTYRIQLEVVKGGYTLTEPIDVIVNTAPVTPTPLSIVSQPTYRVVDKPVSQVPKLGDKIILSIAVTGDGPFIYDWFCEGDFIGRTAVPSIQFDDISGGLAGDIHCEIHYLNGSLYGVLNSSTVRLTISDAGHFVQGGGLWRDHFKNIAGSAVSDLTSHPNYPRLPTYGEVIPIAESAQKIGDNYGSRWSGWLQPDVTGSYTFYLAADYSSELWLSTDEHPANKVKIHSQVNTLSRNWNDAGPSSSVNLTAGQLYYIEVLHKENTVSDYCGVAWQKPGEGIPANGSSPIPGRYLSYKTGGVYGSTAALPPFFNGASYAWNVDENASIGTSVGTVIANTSNTPLTYSISAGNNDGLFSINSSTGEITLAKELDYEAAPSHTLTIQATDSNGLVGAGVSAVVNVNDIYDALFIVNTDFEAADGFTGYTSNNYAPLQATTDNLGAQWSNPGGAYIWNKSGLPPSGVQCLVLGLGGSPSSAEITIPGVDHGVSTVSFDYSSFSNSTNATTKLYYRQNGGAWVEAWSVTIVGLSPNWQVKPWQPVTVNINQTGDIDLKFETTGTQGIQIDTFRVKDYRPNVAPIANDSTMSIIEVASVGDLVGTVDADNTNTGDPLSYAITAGNTGNAFAINPSTGEITVNGALDYATLNSYSLTVSVTDSLGLSDTATVTVEVLQEYFNDDFERTAGTTIGNGWIEQINDSRIYNSNNGATQAVISVNSGDTFSIVRPFSRTLAAGDRYELVWNATRAATIFATMYYDVSIGTWDSATSTFTPLASKNGSIENLRIYEKRPGPAVYATATAAEAGKPVAIRFQTLAGSATWVGFDDIKLRALPTNVAPVAVNANFAINEGAPAGTSVGTITSLDPDKEDTRNFAITAGNAGGEFTIDSSTGEITTTATPLDYETQNSYNLTVTVSDAGGATDSAAVTVDVIDGPDDVDNDGLQDQWEITNFGNMTTANGTTDSDGDGQSDLAEQNAGTNPQDDTDTLKITEMSKSSSNSSIKWTSKTGKSYKVQSSYNLDHWIDIATGQSGSNGEGLYSDTNTGRLGASKVFYRIIVE